MKHKLTDAHAHLGSRAEIEERIQGSIPTLLCAVNPQEARRLEAEQKLPGAENILIPTYGLHPWHADPASLKEMKPYLEQAPIIGEIGMDSVWGTVPLSMQREVFEYQLDYAARNQKPVILHTKGQERPIAEMIRQYSNTYLIHWYSEDKYQKEYLEQGCYFSIGPDVWWNPTVQKLAERVPIDRLLIETDGMGAVQWAYEEAKRGGVKTGAAEEPTVPVTVQEALFHTLETVAAIRKVESEWLAGQIADNFWDYI